MDDEEAIPQWKRKRVTRSSQTATFPPTSQSYLLGHQIASVATKKSRTNNAVRQIEESGESSEEHDEEDAMEEDTEDNTEKEDAMEEDTEEDVEEENAEEENAKEENAEEENAEEENAEEEDAEEENAEEEDAEEENEEEEDAEKQDARKQDIVKQSVEEQVTKKQNTREVDTEEGDAQEQDVGKQNIEQDDTDVVHQDVACKNAKRNAQRNSQWNSQKDIQQDAGIRQVIGKATSCITAQLTIPGAKDHLLVPQSPTLLITSGAPEYPEESTPSKKRKRNNQYRHSLPINLQYQVKIRAMNLDINHRINVMRKAASEQNDILKLQDIALVEKGLGYIRDAGGDNVISVAVWERRMCVVHEALLIE